MSKCELVPLFIETMQDDMIAIATETTQKNVFCNELYIIYFDQSHTDLSASQATNLIISSELEMCCCTWESLAIMVIPSTDPNAVKVLCNVSFHS